MIEPTHPLVQTSFEASLKFETFDRPTLGALIRAERKRVGVTQVELSKALGLSQSALSKIETGILVVDVIQWMAFCRIVTARDALIREGKIRAPKKKKKRPLPATAA